MIILPLCRYLSDLKRVIIMGLIMARNLFNSTHTYQSSVSCHCCESKLFIAYEMPRELKNQISVFTLNYITCFRFPYNLAK